MSTRSRLLGAHQRITAFSRAVEAKLSKALAELVTCCTTAVLPATQSAGPVSLLRADGMQQVADGGAVPGGPTLDLDATVQYMDGCLRSHTSRLSVPVVQPFRCAMCRPAIAAAVISGDAAFADIPS